jgi:hypothetical protein
MKKMTFILALFVSLTQTYAFDAELPRMTTKNYKFTEFKQLLIEGAFEVYLNYGVSSEMSIQASPTVMNHLLIDQEGDMLAIRTTDGLIANNERAILVITVGNLSQISAKDVHSLETLNPMWFENLNVFIHSHARSNLNLIGNALKLQTTGAGDVHISGTIKDVTVSNQGLGAIITEDLCIGKLVMAQTANTPFELNINDKGKLKMQNSNPVLQGIRP